jgi:hypothetical protein
MAEHHSEGLQEPSRTASEVSALDLFKICIFDHRARMLIILHASLEMLHF